MPSLPSEQYIAEELTKTNYKRKFCALLDCEEKAHSEILEMRFAFYSHYLLIAIINIIIDAVVSIT